MKQDSEDKLAHVLEAIGYDYMSVTDIYKKAGVPLEFMTITEGGSNSEV